MIHRLMLAVGTALVVASAMGLAAIGAYGAVRP